MKGLIKSFSPFFKKTKRLKRYSVEIFLLATAFFTLLVSIFLYQQNQNEKENVIITEESFENKKIFKNQTIFVDIAGAVNKPNVYETSAGARLKDIFILAGGLSEEADKSFFQRNFNLARIVNDQEKIYVPSVWEINSGLIVENPRTLDYLSPQAINQPTTNEQNISEKININQASVEELDTLPDVGQVTAQKIINNRPYQTLEELLTKKVVNKSLFEKIKDLITL